MDAQDREERRRVATIRAPAKINLTLQVCGRRDDGFHELRSLVIGVGLYDRLCCSTSERTGIEIECNDATLCDHRNLAYSAAGRLAEHIKLNPALRIKLDKQIPIGSGLGGGSSDAAATLLLCRELWERPLPLAELASVGATLGSDVPLFFSLPGAEMSGRGEIVVRTHLRWSGWVLMVFAGVAVPTADAYGAWRATECARRPSTVAAQIALATSAEDIQALAYNDLEPAVFRIAPRVWDVKQQLDQMGFGPFRVSGAGSALYRLFDQEEQAVRAARETRERCIGSRVEVAAAPLGMGSVTVEEC